jgi:hypothetical protein
VRGDEADVDQDGTVGSAGRGGGVVVVVNVRSSPAALAGVGGGGGGVLFIAAALLPVGDPGAQQLCQAAPGVVLGVGLEEVVLAAVARQLELGADLGEVFLKEGGVKRGGERREDEREERTRERKRDKR